MKIIFLDIDGVLTDSGSIEAKIGLQHQPDFAVEALSVLTEEFDELPEQAQQALMTINPVSVELLNKLLHSSKAILVLLSEHRLLFRELPTGIVEYGSEEHISLLRLYLLALGIKVPNGFGVTKLNAGYRYDAVTELLSELDDVSEYVVLDDSQMHEGIHPQIRCNSSIGLTFEGYATARLHLCI